MGQTGLPKITQTRHCAGENRRQSKEKPMLSSTGWKNPEKGDHAGCETTLSAFSWEGGGLTKYVRAQGGRPRREREEIREESSSRKPEIALPRQGSSGALIYRIFQAAVFEKCRIPRKESEARSFQRLLPSLPFGGLFSIFPGRGIFRRKSHGGA